jgi:hypothetical protein
MDNRLLLFIFLLKFILIYYIPPNQHIEYDHMNTV